MFVVVRFASGVHLRLNTQISPESWQFRISVTRAVDDTLIAEAGRRLAAAAPDAQVILFGSHARGEAGPHSDVDFLVVEPEVANEAEESVRLHRTLRDLRMPADVIVVSRDYADRWREVRGCLVHVALSQGRVLAG
jgi:predicted nucleotidyltransferase